MKRRGTKHMRNKKTKKKKCDACAWETFSAFITQPGLMFLSFNVRSRYVSYGIFIFYWQTGKQESACALFRWLFHFELFFYSASTSKSSLIFKFVPILFFSFTSCFTMPIRFCPCECVLEFVFFYGWFGLWMELVEPNETTKTTTNNDQCERSAAHTVPS